MLTVNGENIDPSLIDNAFLRIKSEAEAMTEASCCERDDEFRARAEEEVIDSILLAQEAERSTPAPDENEIRTEFEALLKQWREQGASWEMLQQRRDELRDELASKLRMDRFTSGIWDKLDPLTDDDLRAWYDRHADHFRTPPEARALHLVRFPEAADPWHDYAAMLELRTKALAGDDFTSLAKEHTRKPDGEIDLGWIRQERILNPFEAMLFSLQVGETSPVFSYEQALHLVHVLETKPADTRPFDSVREEVAARALAEQRQAALRKLAAKLRETATITRNDD
jgi:hypothetical protein